MGWQLGHNGKKDGMIPLDESLEGLVYAGQITAETAKRFAKDPQSLRLTRSPAR